MGHNLSSDAAGGDTTSTGPGGFLNASGDIRNTNPQLDPAGLANNGGPTPTIALTLTSLAKDAGNDSLAPLVDQRGFPRNGVSDIGAFESDGPPLPLSAVSRKTHGGVGDFDINLPLTGSAGVECRRGDTYSDYTLLITFPSPVSVNRAGVTAGSGQVGTGGAANGLFYVNGNVVTVPLTLVGNQQTLVVTLFGVNDGNNAGNVNIAMSLLVADSNGDGTVNSGDAQQTRNRSGQTTSATNFRSDYNLDGNVNSGDATIVRSRSGTCIP
jgi:hypothetical protein